jgi:hypothetical protein
MKCTGVAGREFPDGQVSRRNPVISVVIAANRICVPDTQCDLYSLQWLFWR